MPSCPSSNWNLFSSSNILLFSASDSSQTVSSFTLTGTKTFQYTWTHNTYQSPTLYYFMCRFTCSNALYSGALFYSLSNVFNISVNYCNL